MLPKLSTQCLKIWLTPNFEHCLLGATQNQNEALHHLIWGFCSKVEFHSKETVQLCTAMAVLLWNRGGESVLRPWRTDSPPLLKNMDIEPGAFTINYVNCLEANHAQKARWHEQKTKIFSTHLGLQSTEICLKASKICNLAVKYGTQTQLTYFFVFELLH